MYTRFYESQDGAEAVTLEQKSDAKDLKIEALEATVDRLEDEVICLNEGLWQLYGDWSNEREAVRLLVRALLNK